MDTHTLLSPLLLLSLSLSHSFSTYYSSFFSSSLSLSLSFSCILWYLRHLASGRGLVSLCPTWITLPFQGMTDVLHILFLYRCTTIPIWILRKVPISGSGTPRNHREEYLNAMKYGATVLQAISTSMKMAGSYHSKLLEVVSKRLWSSTTSL